ncbi:MAG: IclR family transcriptional regulator [candidate division NC10 bacterium]|nr:IclR family transcriptional regulator [candidate division NC10 bacterium]
MRKAIRVLKCFSLQEPHLSLSEIADRVGLARSTTHRILATLRDEGMLEQDGRRELYRLGLEVFEMGSVVLANMELHREALPFIEELARETGETIHLGVFDGTQVVSIEKMDSPRGLTTVVTIGKGAPAYCTGVGKALLSFQPEAVVDRICKMGLTHHTPQTITDPASLRQELAKIRVLGYAVDDRELHPDVRCVAAPIRDHTGNVVASISISGPATRIQKSAIPSLAKMIRAVAAKLSARLGHTVLESTRRTGSSRATARSSAAR